MTFFDKLYQEYAEGTPLSTLAKRYNTTVPKLRKMLKEYR
jgi:hypothetical protein